MSQVHLELAHAKLNYEFPPNLFVLSQSFYPNLWQLLYLFRPKTKSSLIRFFAVQHTCHLQILLILSSRYIWNIIISCHLYCYHYYHCSLELLHQALNWPHSSPHSGNLIYCRYKIQSDPLQSKLDHAIPVFKTF